MALTHLLSPGTVKLKSCRKYTFNCCFTLDDTVLLCGKYFLILFLLSFMNFFKLFFLLFSPLVRYMHQSQWVRCRKFNTWLQLCIDKLKHCQNTLFCAVSVIFLQDLLLIVRKSDHFFIHHIFLRGLFKGLKAGFCGVVMSENPACSHGKAYFLHAT